MRSACVSVCMCLYALVAFTALLIIFILLNNDGAKLSLAFVQAIRKATNMCSSSVTIISEFYSGQWQYPMLTTHRNSLFRFLKNKFNTLIYSKKNFFREKVIELKIFNLSKRKSNRKDFIPDSLNVLQAQHA